MNKEELEKVEQLIEQKDSEQLKDLLAGLHPADIAELCNELDAEEAAAEEAEEAEEAAELEAEEQHEAA